MYWLVPGVLEYHPLVRNSVHCSQIKQHYFAVVPSAGFPLI